MTSFAETMTFLSRNRLQFAPTTITNHYFNSLPYDYIKKYPILNGKMVLMVWCGWASPRTIRVKPFLDVISSIYKNFVEKEKLKNDWYTEAEKEVESIVSKIQHLSSWNHKNIFTSEMERSQITSTFFSNKKLMVEREQWKGRRQKGKYLQHFFIPLFSLLLHALNHC